MFNVTKRIEAYNNNGNFPIPLVDRFMSSIIRNSSMSVFFFLFLSFSVFKRLHIDRILYAHTISLLNLALQLLLLFGAHFFFFLVAAADDFFFSGQPSSDSFLFKFFL